MGPCLRGEGLEKDPFLVARLVLQAKSGAKVKLWIKDWLFIDHQRELPLRAQGWRLKEGDLKGVPCGWSPTEDTGPYSTR